MEATSQRNMAAEGHTVMPSWSFYYREYRATRKPWVARLRGIVPAKTNHYACHGYWGDIVSSPMSHVFAHAYLQFVNTRKPWKTESATVHALLLRTTRS